MRVEQNPHLIRAYKEYQCAREQCRKGCITDGALSQYRDRLRTVYRIIAGKEI